MREKVTFNLRSPFPELESICYLFNKMMISGKGNHAELKIGKSKEKDIDYITINVYRCRKYPSVTLNRDVDLIDFETEKELIDDGLLESFDVITLIAELEDQFEVEIPAEEIVPENFNSAEGIWNLLQRIKGED